jgi:oligopeptide/dipeptide ABC transporter ATP-binding protein
MSAAKLLEVENLFVFLGGERRFLARRAPLVRAVDGVSLALAEGEMLGLVGESGCGKSTLARAIYGLQREAGGEIWLGGRRVSDLEPRAARAARRAIEYVWQDAAAALDPWWRVGSTLDETLRAAGENGAARREATIAETLQAVGLDPALARRYPHELSGGQLRRIGLARALVVKPRILILDEPTAGLDLSVQATILALIADLRARFGLTCLLISHDLSVVRTTCARTAIMYLGRIVETASTAALFKSPHHPYTRGLLDAAPHIDAAAELGAPILEGDTPSPVELPPGCRFAPRCAHATEACAASEPRLERIQGTSREIACHRWREIG